MKFTILHSSVVEKVIELLRAKCFYNCLIGFMALFILIIADKQTSLTLKQI